MKCHSDIPFRIHVGGQYRHPAMHGVTLNSPIGLLLTPEDFMTVRERGPIKVSIRSRHAVEMDLVFDQGDGAGRLSLVTKGFRIRPDTTSIAEIIHNFDI